MTYTVTVEIPLALEPLERGERFELPLCDLFDETEAGDVVGGGTHVTEGEIDSAVIELEIEDFSLLARIANVLARGGAPLGTTLSLGPPTGKAYVLQELLESPTCGG